MNELTIVIPAKNEEQSIPNLLRSLGAQTTYLMSQVPIILADADSTDRTVEVAKLLASRLNLMGFQVIKGGLPAVGRNAGTRLIDSRYVLFIDADVELEDPTLIGNAIVEMGSKGLHCLTTDIHVAPAKYWWSSMVYSASNVCQRVSRFLGVPYATGMFMLFDREEFLRLGGFREDAMYGEDYMLSRKVGWRRFRVIAGGIRTSDRRMRMGFWRLIKLFVVTALFAHRDSTFTMDRGYWDA